MTAAIYSTIRCGLQVAIVSPDTRQLTSKDRRTPPAVPRTEDLLISPEPGTTSRGRRFTLAEARP
jgi:hypothetical protein